MSDNDAMEAQRDAARSGALSRVTSRKLGLEALAEKHGYVCGDFDLERLTEDIAMMRRWCDDIRREQVPEELSGMSFKEARELVVREAIDVARRDRDWRDYFYGKVKSIEQTLVGDADRPVNIDVHFVKPGEV